MKIESGPQSKIVPLEAALLKKTAGGPAKGAQAPKTSGDAFSVQFSAAVDKMKSPPENDDVRRDKVEAIKKQLASGTYNISGKDVAAKILSVLKG
ncbi:MAG TPA: flagellar biosynthesis anti-sigma factor FlgM [Desulfuromonadaceae bacterium]